MGKLLRISKGGQISVPARVRKRWQTSNVIAEDHGNELVIRPAVDDPIEAAAGSLAEFVQQGPPAAEAVRKYRDEDSSASDRRWQH